ncbi:hypothetical protein ACLI1A_10285 [Flavobacterium sp. RHBU_3]|uniref:hypothetical protein n=1 Tax=Flavobacterium sp. RHBU_3 TaxID=3391184 RepID=UPI0039853A3D
MSDKLRNFIDSMVTIDYIEEKKEYGHYPFVLLATKDGKAELNALSGLRSEQCYERYAYYAIREYDEILMSMDFPPNGDIETDFVFVFAYLDASIDARAITYDKETGKRLNEYTAKDKKILAAIVTQFLNTYPESKK